MLEFFSTDLKERNISLVQALLNGFSKEGALYLPQTLPFFSPNTLKNWRKLTFQEISLHIAKELFQGILKDSVLEQLISEVFYFPIQMRVLGSKLYGLELFHGPTFSFKDFGARFMAHLWSHLRSPKDSLTVLVATSGDTGSAVGHAFSEIPGTHVYILYAKGKVTPFQEKQLTTIEKNVTAIEIDGTFDDCQNLLKKAVCDRKIRQKKRITTANSINIARILPQSFYYFYAYTQIPENFHPIVVSVPCGNFGHLVSGILAKRMGLPIARFLAATNINDEVPLFLKSGSFVPQSSKDTIAVSMDVGNPSNFQRLEALYEYNVEKMRKDIVGDSFTDDEIRSGIKEMFRSYHYIVDPHGATGYLALQRYQKLEANNHAGLFFMTAHPAKFLESLMHLLPIPIEIPESLQATQTKQKHAISLSNSYKEFKDFLLS
jgi:threonine synthase